MLLDWGCGDGMLRPSTKELQMSAMVFSGTAGVNTFRAITLKSGLALYAKTGMKPNRMWSPKNMMALASEITGKKFKARDYQGAVDALAQWIEANGRASDPVTA